MDVVFESEQMATGLLQALISETDNCVKVFIDEVKQSLNKGKEAIDSDKAQLVIEDGVHKITASAKFYADAILESYGLGSLADTGANSYWDEYTKSRYFNKLRTSTTIVGRPRGSYVDPWGKQHSTWGGMAGKNIEGMEFEDKNGNLVRIEPKAPTYAIQNAEKWIIGKTDTWIERRLITAATKWIMENASRFFHN